MEPVDAINLLRTYLLHRHHVKRMMQSIATTIANRAESHDMSKLSSEEFEGFSRINKIAREYPYNSKEYKDSLLQEQPTVHRHYQMNTHHPEHDPDKEMYWIDIIEMVCDWYAAYLSYNSKQSWEENMGIQKKRFHFTKEEQWLVEQISRFIATVK